MKWTGPDYSIHTHGSLTTTGPDDEWIDLVVAFSEREKYTATFYTLEKIRLDMEECAKTGELCAGKYWCDRSCVIVKTFDEATIVEVISDMVAAGRLKHVFERCSNADDTD